MENHATVTPTRARPPFGVLLRLHRERRGLSCMALARAAGLDVSHVSRLESGSRRPTPETIAFLVEALDLPPVEATALSIVAFVPPHLRTAVREALVRQDGGCHE